MSGTVRMRLASAACILLILGSPAARAADFPRKPVRFLVGYAPGGGTDVLARVIARRLSDTWGQAVVAENRAGAGGTIAANLVAHAPPDGYTILMITTNHTVPSSEYKNPGYDPIRSFAPVVEIAYIPSALLINTALRVNSAKEFIELARARPGQLNFGGTGPGSAQFVDMQLLMASAGIKLTEVTYKGAAPSLLALLSNEIQVTLAPVTAFLEAIKAGRLKVLAVSGTVRSPLLPDVPTFRETAGLKGFEGSANWYGIVAPAGTPRNLVLTLHDAVAAAIQAPEVQRLLSDQGFVTIAGSPEAFGARIAADLSKWARLAKTMDGK